MLLSPAQIKSHKEEKWSLNQTEKEEVLGVGGKQENFDRNQYYTFKLHRYTNIQDYNVSLPAVKNQDIEIPMKPCRVNNDFDGNWDMSATHFCPEFRPTDIMRGSYYTKKYSWLRLAVHRCNPNEIVNIDGKM